MDPFSSPFGRPRNLKRQSVRFTIESRVGDHRTLARSPSLARKPSNPLSVPKGRPGPPLAATERKERDYCSDATSPPSKRRHTVSHKIQAKEAKSELALVSPSAKRRTMLSQTSPSVGARTLDKRSVTPTMSPRRCASVPPKDQAVDVASPALSSDSRFEQDQGSIAIINSVEVIPRLTTKYVPYFNWDSDSHHSANEKVATLRLLYPAPDSSEEYPLLVPRVGKSDAHVANEYVPINELINTVHVVGKYLLGDELATKAVTDPGTGILRMLERARNKRDGPGFVRAVQDYNRIIEARRAVLDGIGYKKWGLPYELVTHVMDQVYNRVVAPKVDLLGNYKAFSNNVYGEVNPILVKEFIKRTNLGPDGVFVDLGCGVGNVVLQIVAQAGCEGHGIEIMEIPARLAKRQAHEFKARMRLYNVRTNKLEIIHGDFLENPEIHSVLRQASVVLVNNYAFDSKLNQSLMQLFLDLEDGTQIISLRPFVPLDFKLSTRNAGSPESILRVKCYPYWSDCVSWTNNGGEYYIHTVDRSQLQRFFEQLP